MAIQLQQLRKRYIGPDGSVVPVVDIGRFELTDGEQVALIGSSGSGKTTLLHLIAGILTPDSGRIVFGLKPAPAPTNIGLPTSATLPYRSSSPPEPPAVDIARLSEARRDVFRGRHIGYI